MVNMHRRYFVNREIVTVSSATPTPVVVAQSGFSVGLLNVQFVNQQNFPVAVTIWEEASKIIPTVPLGASGTFLWEEPGGNWMELTAGSGVKASVTPGGNSAEIGIQYVLIDNRTPITKEAARRATYDATAVTTAIRRPNRRGEQQEG